MEVDQVLVSAVQLPNLSLLGAGSAPGRTGRADLIRCNVGFGRKLRKRFEFIVIDSPPMLCSRWPSAFSRSQTVIVVGRSGVTTRENLKRTMDLLRGVRSAPVVELVLNAAEHTAMDYRLTTATGMQADR